MIDNRHKAFVSYSHKDDMYREEFEIHLSTLKRQGLIDVWNDHRILAGDEIDDTINTNLSNSSQIFLLISPDFIASNYCYCKEFEFILNRHKKNETRIIPIILRPTDVAGTPFMKFKVLPKDAKPITTWENRDNAWVDVIKGIRNIIENSSDSSYMGRKEPSDNKEKFLKIKSKNDFKLIYREWFNHEYPQGFNDKINEIINDRYAPLSVFYKCVDIRLEFLLLPILKKRIEIETNLRIQYIIPYTEEAVIELKEEIKEIILEWWPNIIDSASIDAEQNTIKQHGNIPEYKHDEIWRANEENKTKFPDGLFNMAIEMIKSDYAKTMLNE